MPRAGVQPPKQTSDWVTLVTSSFPQALLVHRTRACLKRTRTSSKSRQEFRTTNVGFGFIVILASTVLLLLVDYSAERYRGRGLLSSDHRPTKLWRQLGVLGAPVLGDHHSINYPENEPLRIGQLSILHCLDSVTETRPYIWPFRDRRMESWQPLTGKKVLAFKWGQIVEGQTLEGTERACLSQEHRVTHASQNIY